MESLNSCFQLDSETNKTCIKITAKNGLNSDGSIFMVSE